MPTVKKQSAKKTVRRKTTREKKSNAIDRISPIQFDDDEGININLYGRSGTGKTTLWATFPKPILAVVCSGGRRPGELRSINTAEYRKTVDKVVVEKVQDIKDLVGHQEEEGKYKTFVVDHVTSLQDYVLAEILEVDSIPEQGSWGMAKQQDWGQCTLQMKDLLRSILDMTCNVVIVAQEREFNTDSESTHLMPYTGSALTPSLAGWLNYCVDYIGETFIQQRVKEVIRKVGQKKIKSVVDVPGEVDYCLRAAPHPVFTTKFRVPKGTVLPPYIADPTYDKIMSLIQGKG